MFVDADVLSTMSDLTAMTMFYHDLLRFSNLSSERYTIETYTRETLEFLAQYPQVSVYPCDTNIMRAILIGWNSQSVNDVSALLCGEPVDQWLVSSTYHAFDERGVECMSRNMSRKRAMSLKVACMI